MDLLAGYKIRISEIHNFATDALWWRCGGRRGGGVGCWGCVMFWDSGRVGRVTVQLLWGDGWACQPCQEVLIGATHVAFTCQGKRRVTDQSCNTAGSEGKKRGATPPVCHAVRDNDENSLSRAICPTITELMCLQTSPCLSRHRVETNGASLITRVMLNPILYFTSIHWQ